MHTIFNKIFYISCLSFLGLLINSSILAQELTPIDQMPAGVY